MHQFCAQTAPSSLGLSSFQMTQKTAESALCQVVFRKNGCWVLCVKDKKDHLLLSMKGAKVSLCDGMEVYQCT